MNPPTFLSMQEVTWVGLQALIAAAGLVILGFYARDTRQIRKATLAQSSASRRPFFTLASADEQGQLRWLLHNVGVGPALDSEWTFRHSVFSSEQAVSTGAVAPGSSVTLRESGSPMERKSLIVHHGVRVTYSDTAGKRYWTEIECTDEYGWVSFAVTTGEL